MYIGLMSFISLVSGCKINGGIKLQLNKICNAYIDGANIKGVNFTAIQRRMKDVGNVIGHTGPIPGTHDFFVEYTCKSEHKTRLCQFLDKYVQLIVESKGGITESIPFVLEYETEAEVTATERQADQSYPGKQDRPSIIVEKLN